jgi:colanic acid/amylovoran biosynthesis glycosyltransferase
MRIAYLTNQYPKVSHSFIRREILALERAGVTVERISVRGWDEALVDPDDVAERARTHYLLRSGLGGLLPAVLKHCVQAPLAFLRAARLALGMSHMSERPWMYHLVYLAQACRLAQQCAQRQVTHLHAHFGTNSAEVAMLARLLGGPSYSFTVHGPDEFDRPQGLHLREKVAHASHVIAISSFGQSQLYRWVDPDHWPRVRVVHCGLEPGYFPTSPPPPTAAPRLVCVGRLSAQKGQLLLLDAVRQLRDAGESFQLVLAGDGEMRGELERYIGQHGLESHVSITGWISGERVKQELLAARAMVLGSFAEGLPVVIMEAMALGRPVITTSIAGIPELVRHGVDGWLVPAGDTEALAAAIRTALHTPAERLSDMGAEANARVRARHDIDHEAARLVHIFQEAACQPR